MMPRFAGTLVDEGRRPRFAGVPVAENGDAPVTAGGLAQAAASGLRLGAEGFAGLPGDVGELVGTLGGKAAGIMGASPEAIDKVKGLGRYVGLGGPNIGNIVGDVTGHPEMFPTSSGDIHALTSKAIGPSYEAQNTPEKFVKTGAEFLPAALGGEGSLLTRIGQALTSGVASEGAGQATKGTALEPYARIAAALLAPLGLSGARRAITPVPTSPERTAMADTLAQEGVETTAGQRTGSKRLRYMEGEIGGQAAQDIGERQGEQFTRATLERAGINEPRATPEVIDGAFTRIGGELDNLAANNQIPFDRQFQDDLLNAATGYAENTGESGRAPLIENIMNDAATLARGGTLDGEAYARLRTRITDGIRKGDSNTRGALIDMREALDDAIERHLPADTVERWRTARNQYRNMLVIEQAATAAGEGARAGLISPSSLRAATVANHGRRNFARGQGDFAELARAGEGVMKPLPDSGTAGRINAHNVGAGALSILGGGAGAMHSPEAAMAGILLGGAIPGGLGRLMMSGPVQAYLGNQLWRGGGNSPTTQALIQALIAGKNQPAIEGQ